MSKPIRELRQQLLRLQPHGGPYSQSILAQATYFLNSVVRHSGRSAREIWSSRDQHTGANITLQDPLLSDIQFHQRQKSHKSSAQYTSRNGKKMLLPNLNVGDIVFIKSESSKSKARESYFIFVTDHVKKIAKIQKFPVSHSKHRPIMVEYQNMYKSPAVVMHIPQPPKLQYTMGDSSSHPRLPLSNPPKLMPNSDCDGSSSCSEVSGEECSSDEFDQSFTDESDHHSVHTFSSEETPYLS